MLIYGNPNATGHRDQQPLIAAGDPQVNRAVGVGEPLAGLRGLLGRQVKLAHSRCWYTDFALTCEDQAICLAYRDRPSVVLADIAEGFLEDIIVADLELDVERLALILIDMSGLTADRFTATTSRLGSRVTASLALPSASKDAATARRDEGLTQP